MLTYSQKVGWLNWMRIRGEVGPQRMDFYVAYIANTIKNHGHQFGKDAGISTFMEAMPWAVAQADLDNILST
jgi:hypothetical protein